MWSARLMRWALVLGGGFALLSLFAVMVDALGGLGAATATQVDVTALLYGPDGQQLMIDYVAPNGDQLGFGGVIVRHLTLADVGWPPWAPYVAAGLRHGLLAAALLWGASAFEAIRDGEGLHAEVGRTLRRAGLLWLGSEAVQAMMILSVHAGAADALHDGRIGLPAAVTAAVRAPAAVGVGGLLALAVVVLGLVIEQAAPIVEEHELTV